MQLFTRVSPNPDSWSYPLSFFSFQPPRRALYCTTLAIGRHIGVALLLSFHPVGLRCDAPVEGFVAKQGVKDGQRALALQPSGTVVPYVHAPPTLVEQFSSQVSTTPIPGRAVPLCPPHQGSDVLRAASSFKRRRESRTLRSAVPSAAVLFVVFVVVGPSGLRLCLTGTSHYNFDFVDEHRARRELVAPDTLSRDSVPNPLCQRCCSAVDVQNLKDLTLREQYERVCSAARSMSAEIVSAVVEVIAFASGP